MVTYQNGLYTSFGGPVMYIHLRDVKKNYIGKTTYEALKGVDLQIKKGEFIGIMGPSGAGKTTLLNILSTIDSPTSGELNIDGSDIVALNEDEKADYRGEYLGFVFQDYNLINNMSVKENILLPLMIKGKTDEFSQVKYIADKLGLSDLLGRYPFELSGGEKQRVAAARAVINKPKLLLADEPTGNLDSKSASNFLNMLKEISQTNELTTIMVTHDPYVASFTDKVFILKDGMINSEINSNGKRKELHEKLIASLSILGGE